jgi:phage gp37-like protein
VEYQILVTEVLEVLEVLTYSKNRMLVVVSEIRSLVLVQVVILVAVECHSRIMAQNQGGLKRQETLGTTLLVSDQRLVGRMVQNMIVLVSSMQCLSMVLDFHLDLTRTPRVAPDLEAQHRQNKIQ